MNHQETRANYDRLSRWYDPLSASSERAAKMCGLQLLDVQSGERVLEVGCGTGEMLPALAARARYVHGLDLSAGMLHVAMNKISRQSLSNVAHVQGDGLHLPFAGEAFDAIFVSFTLELFPEEESSLLLQECARVLRNGGRVGVVSLLQSEKPGWMERIYTWAHQRWPRAIDCRPILLEDTVEKSNFKISTIQKMSMWGLAVGILVAFKQQ